MTPSEILAKAVTKIIAEQEQIIGPVALEQAKQVEGLSVDWDRQQVTMTRDSTAVVEELVEHYRSFFGPAAVEVCKDATRDLLSQLPLQQIPLLLR